MSCEKPLPPVNLLSKEATRELTNSLPDEGKKTIEVVVVVDSEGQLSFFFPNKKIGDNVVQTDTCKGLCFAHEVSTEDPCRGDQFIVKDGFTTRGVPCDADIVKKLTSRTVPDNILVPLAFSIYPYSGCACSSGSCIHW